MERESQNSMILRYLESGLKLGPITALNSFGCFRLAARICDLRDNGYDIKTEIITTETGKRYATYKLEK